MNVRGPSSKAQDVARYLIAYEANGKDRSETDPPAALQVCEKLRGPLTTLTGAAGFRSILMRALALAKRESSALELVEIGDDGALVGLTRSAAEPGGTLLIVKLLGLLITFVGDALTMRLLIEIWPNLLGVDLISGERE